MSIVHDVYMGFTWCQLYVMFTWGLPDVDCIWCLHGFTWYRLYLVFTCGLPDVDCIWCLRGVYLISIVRDIYMGFTWCRLYLMFTWGLPDVDCIWYLHGVYLMSIVFDVYLGFTWCRLYLFTWILPDVYCIWCLPAVYLLFQRPPLPMFKHIKTDTTVSTDSAVITVQYLAPEKPHAAWFVDSFPIPGESESARSVNYYYF